LWKPDPTGKSANGIFWNRGSFAENNDAAAAILEWDKDPDWTVYFSVGRMANNAETDAEGKIRYRRTKAHASWFKALCFDLDIGGKYATQKDGHAAVVEAIRKIGLPDPMVISSGRGLHYYWPLVEPVQALEWEKTSIALRAAFAEHQVELDVSKIHDTSMVLRPVGTHHKKQTPWKDVKLLADSADYEWGTLTGTLQKWITAAPAAQPNRTSSISSAILDNCNLNLDAIGRKCAQVKALLATGGEFDAAGAPVAYSTWTASLMLAKFTPDPAASIMRLCGGHPGFDIDDNLDKMASFSGKPPSCDQFTKACPSGCAGCPSKGIVFGPGSLNEELVATPSTPTAKALQNTGVVQAELVMPDGYYVSNGAIYTDIEVEKKSKDEATGKPVTTTSVVRTLVCPYEIHVLAMFHDVWGVRSDASSKSAATILVKYPMDGEQEHELPLSWLASGGKEFSSYLGDKQIIIPSDTVKARTNTYLMNYLASVQARAASGVDFTRFGWQKDGSFLCGEKLLGSPSKNILRRLKGGAKLFSEHVACKGDRDTWADLTRYVDHSGGEPLGVSLLMACAGVLGNVSGAATPIVSFVSQFSGTGKTLSLAFGNSAFMDPSEKFMFNPKDTTNALYNGFGIFGDLSASIDEITTMDPVALANLAYDAARGCEKKSLTSDRNMRPIEEWRAPVRVTSNRSLFEVYELVQSKDEPLRMRTMEFPLNKRDFVAEHGKTIYLAMQDNFGFAVPELAQAVIDLGGRRAVWDKGSEKFAAKYDKMMDWAPEERFRRNATAVAYTLGKIGQKLGLFKFDVDRVIDFILQNITRMRTNAHITVKDAFDIVGQFMQEHNDQLITTRRVGGGAEQVQFPVPQVACMRMEIIVDAAGNLQKGSRLAINAAVLKTWLRRTRDSLEHLSNDLVGMGGALAALQRVTIYKGCQTGNPGQAHCLIVDLTHPRLAYAVTGRPMAVTSPAPAVLQTASAS